MSIEIPAAAPDRQWIAATGDTPYYAVIFTSVLSGDTSGYAETADAMLEAAQRQPGFLGAESAREGVGITVSYWASLEAIAAWKRDAEHLVAQRVGSERWYDAYRTRICRVERDYGSDRR